MAPGQRLDAGCPACKFLGTYKEYDLFYCPSGGIYQSGLANSRATLRAAYMEHDDAGDYMNDYTGIVFGKYHYENHDDHPLAFAYALALEKGYIEKDNTVSTAGVISLR